MWEEREVVLKSKNGPKGATLADVARMAGVSAKTVSRVVRGNDYVSEKTLERVQQAIKETGYIPNRAARSLASDRTGVVGIIIPSIINPFYPEVVSGIEHICLEHDYNLLMFNTLGDNRREREALRYLRENRADGVIFQCPAITVVDEFEEALMHHRAAVVLGSYPLSVPTGIVRLDIRDAISQVLDHLVQVGRRKLAYIGPQNDTYAVSERLNGITEAAERFDLPIEYAFTGTDVKDGYQTTMKLLESHPEINGLICYHDLLAYGALDGCIDLGVSIPEQVAVVGFDDISYSALKRISLTTLRVPKFALGVQAANLLFSMINGEDIPLEIVVGTELVHRGSTPTID